ncbi:efflux RND transporter periplasmic adaptor subunit [Actimicrobium sp. CCC2.4]|uniref:efflux RND transporter periplasmic adaptor subunit n=1 Tax=Actimicrobium sp. CCC2.4 TaxID=3048606 RepID=UPI002AC91B96|nr:efflux RND transporter periplasmic adaptor subunit [Actimicrobium sp. CCC2.4]MEB0134646.1 efflux RND transporter periplasmic adaptor subunit [Actimicrobium sp. CCC2.4]WPX30590.1 efflux RND transporter periplasmic adaptor subunit [Actimicrobium sp. CCC2.4]
MKKRILLPPLCVSLSFVLTLACSTRSVAADRPAIFAVTQQQMQSLAIRTQPLQRDAAPVVLSLPAQVTVPANRQQMISAPLAGLAVQLFVQPNQAVKQGAPLLRIVSQELGPLQLQLMQADSRTKLSRLAAQRERALFDEGIIARRRVQEAEAALTENEAVLRQARAALGLAGMSAASISRVLASGKLDDGVTLHAAQAGVVTSINVKPGQRVDPAMALLELAQIDRLILEIQAPAAEAANWRVGSKLTLLGRTGTASIVSISPVVTPDSQTVAIRAELGAGSDLRPGEFITAQLPLTSDNTSWDVPLAALAHDGAAVYVFVRGADSFEARKVRQISAAGQRVRIAGSLKAGELIAVAGVVALKGSWLGEKGGD